mmetsp:Transcript_69547/g.225029  ORF Transcript_69547/g.225029 Transcript_69547/m.225029 type:complete len:302 (+) Transcript_69547:101-1006(+)
MGNGAVAGKGHGLQGPVHMRHTLPRSGNAPRSAAARPQLHAMQDAEWPLPRAHSRQHVSKGLPLAVVPGATGRPQPILQKPTMAGPRSFWQVASWPMPSAQPRQQVVRGLPLASTPRATFRPQPLRQSPGPTLLGSMCPQSLSWPKPKMQPRQQVLKDLPARVTPGATRRPQPTLQKPSGTSMSPGPSWSCCSRSCQAAPPSLCMDSARMRACSSSIHENSKPCWAHMFLIRPSMSEPRCLVCTTSLSTCLLNATSPWICASLYFIFPTLLESPSTAASAELATFSVSVSSASLYSLRTWA